MKKVIITGACGFIGTCLSKRLLDQGVAVYAIDNLSRTGTEYNCIELQKYSGFKLSRVDLSNPMKAREVFKKIGKVDAVYHLAAQVAVTTSYDNRHLDFADNAAATINVLECIKEYSPDAYCLYASTNKVYGHLTANKPVGVDFILDPYTPYGVSKATGELYFTEYGRKEMGLRTCSLRQSCIYGHHQYGVEDQGWMAWFSIANLLNKQICIYGDGMQIRDLLFVEDLIDLYLEAYEKNLTGSWPVGGGIENSINLRQGLELIQQYTGKPFENMGSGDVRPGDQPYFVSDNSWAVSQGLNWKPKVGVDEGVTQMIKWIESHLEEIKFLLNSRY